MFNPFAWFSSKKKAPTPSHKKKPTHNSQKGHKGFVRKYPSAPEPHVKTPSAPEPHVKTPSASTSQVSTYLFGGKYTLDDLMNMRKEGKSLEKMVVATGICRSTLYDAIRCHPEYYSFRPRRKNGDRIYKSQWSNWDEEILKLRKEGLSVNSIQCKTGVPKARICDVIKRDPDYKPMQSNVFKKNRLLEEAAKNDAPTQESDYGDYEDLEHDEDLESTPAPTVSLPPEALPPAVFPVIEPSKDSSKWIDINVGLTGKMNLMYDISIALLDGKPDIIKDLVQDYDTRFNYSYQMSHNPTLQTLSKILVRIFKDRSRYGEM